LYIVNYSITHREIRDYTYYSGRPFIWPVDNAVIADVHFFLSFFAFLHTYAWYVVRIHSCCYCYNNNYGCCYCYFTLLYPGDRFVYLFFNILYEIRSDTKPDSIVYEKQKKTHAQISQLGKSSNLEDALNVSFSIEKYRNLHVVTCSRHSRNISDII